ncbi:MAG TPA: spermidine synthase, partial [Mycobacteriales bacterium]|nr:spermidine synthase [Mycobacteriales bacterium]
MIVLDRRETPRGELVLRQVEDAFEIISNGTFLMDSRNGASERLLVSAPLRSVAAPRRVLIGGLGMGFSVREALGDRRTESVTVVEIEPAVIEWQRGRLARVSGAALQDPRVQVH